MSESASVTTDKSTRQLVRERAAEERRQKEESKQATPLEDEPAAVSEEPPKKLTKKEKKALKEKERRQEEGFNLKSVFAKANWGVRMAKAFAPKMELTTRNRVRVGVRIRPMNEAERRRGDKDKDKDFMVLETDTAQATLKNPRPPAGQEQKTDYFAFDNLYGADTSTEKVFNDLALPLVSLLIEGYNGTIFAYGQTGSGKVLRSASALPDRLCKAHSAQACMASHTCCLCPHIGRAPSAQQHSDALHLLPMRADA